MTATLSRRNLKNWIETAIEGFRSRDLLGVSDPWMKIYEALVDYIGSEQPIDQKLLWMIEDSEDAFPDVIYQLQRLKNALVEHIVKEGAVSELPRILTWFDKTIVVLAEKATGRISTERSLTEPYETIFWKARDGMYISTIEGKFLHCNEALIKMLNYQSLEEILKMDIQRDLYVDKDDRQVMLRHLFRDGYFDHHEFHFVGADGKLKTALESCYLVKVPNGKQFIVGIMVDVTKEKEFEEKTAHYVRNVEEKGMAAELALHSKNKRYEALLSVNDHPVLLLEPKGFDVLNFNQAFMRRLGYRKKHMGQMNFRDLFQSDDWMGIYDQISHSTRRTHYHIRGVTCVTLEGGTFKANLSVVVHQDDLGSVLFVQIADLSELLDLKTKLKMTRKNLSQLIDGAPIGVIGFKSDGSVALINKYLQGLTGYGNRKLKDVSFVNQIFAREKHRLKFHKYMRQFLRGNHAENVLIDLKTKSGDILKFRLDTIPHQLENEVKPGFLALLTDVTHQIQLEELLKNRAEPTALESLHHQLQEKWTALEEKYEELDRKRRLLQEFLAACAKKFKVPLHLVFGFASLLKKDLADSIKESQREDLAIIEGHIRVLLGMVEKVADFAQLESDDFQVAKEEIWVRSMLDGLFRKLAPEQLPAGVTYSADHQILSLDLKIKLDLPILETMLKHLLDNALTFTPKGKVSLSAYEEDKTLWFEVRDEGLGIAATDLPHVFEPFYQGERVEKQGYQGLGLGLTLVQKYAELTGCQVAIESKVNKGTALKIGVGRTYID